MADKPTQPRKDGRHLITEGGAVPRMTLNIPVPPGTKPPPAPSSQQSSSKPQAHK